MHPHLSTHGPAILDALGYQTVRIPINSTFDFAIPREPRPSQLRAMTMLTNTHKNELRAKQEAAICRLWPDALFARDLDALVTAILEARDLTERLQPSGPTSPWLQAHR